MSTNDWETFQLGPYTVPRLWVGLWQLSSPAWGTAPVSKIKAEMHNHFNAGYTTFADHYGSAEILFGQFRQACIDAAGSPPPDSRKSSTSSRNGNGQGYDIPRNGNGNGNGRTPRINPAVPICADKWCIFRNPSPQLDLAGVEEAIRERMHRTGISDGIDILQIHWQDYSKPQVYLDAFRAVLELRRTRRLRLDVIGLVNFDTKRVIEICEAMGKGEILTNQIQFSLIDVRPLYGMTAACQKHGVKLLTYGTFCGGFLADKWLGRSQPDPYRDHITPSQRKYLDVILNAWGGWELFQTLLATLRAIADRHSTADMPMSIANVATRWVLDQPAVGAVLVGARLGVTEHRVSNARTFKLRLTPEDNQAIATVLARSNGHNLIHSMGDCGSEYR